jgi:hypothetical protein
VKLVRRLLTPVLVVALLGLVAGCGGSSSSSSGSTASTTTAPPSKAPAESETEAIEELGAEGEAAGGGTKSAFIKEGDEVCENTDVVTETLQAEFKKANNPSAPDFEKKLAGLLVRIVVIGRTEGEELASLEPPAGETKAFEEWLSTGEAGLSQFEAAAAELKKGTSPKFTRLYEEGQAKLAKANELAANLGFDVCGGQRAF